MRGLRFLLIATAVLTATGCSLVVGDELDPLQVDLNARRTVSLRLIDFVPHVNQLVVAEFIRTDTVPNVSQAQVRMDPLSSPCMDITLPFGASIGATRVDFWADLMDDGLDDPPTDHTWRRDLDESGRLEFAHEFNFDSVLTDRPGVQGVDLILDVTGMDAMEGSQVIASLVRVVNLNPAGEPNNVESVNAVYRSTVQSGNLGPRRGAGADEPPVLRGVVDQGVPYTLELNIDNGAMRCRLDRQSDPADDFTLAADFSEFTCDTEAPLEVLVDCAR